MDCKPLQLVLSRCVCAMASPAVISPHFTVIMNSACQMHSVSVHHVSLSFRCVYSIPMHGPLRCLVFHADHEYGVMDMLNAQIPGRTFPTLFKSVGLPVAVGMSQVFLLTKMCQVQSLCNPSCLAPSYGCKLSQI